MRLHGAPENNRAVIVDAVDMVDRSAIDTKAGSMKSNCYTFRHLLVEPREVAYVIRIGIVGLSRLNRVDGSCCCWSVIIYLCTFNLLFQVLVVISIQVGSWKS